MLSTKSHWCIFQTLYVRERYVHSKFDDIVTKTTENRLSIIEISVRVHAKSKPFKFYLRILTTLLQLKIKKWKKEKSTVDVQKYYDPSDGKSIRNKREYQKSIKWKRWFEKTIILIHCSWSFFKMYSFTWSILETHPFTWSVFHWKDRLGEF